MNQYNSSELPSTIFGSILQPLYTVSHKKHGFKIDDLIFKVNEDNLPQPTPVKKNKKKSEAQLRGGLQELLTQEYSNVALLASFSSILKNPAFQELFTEPSELFLLQKVCQFLLCYVRFQGRFNHRMSLKENQKEMLLTLEEVQHHYNDEFLNMQNEFVKFIPNFVALNMIFRRKHNQKKIEAYFVEFKMSAKGRKKNEITQTYDPKYKSPTEELLSPDCNARLSQIITRRELMMRNIYADIHESHPSDRAIAKLCIDLSNLNVLVNRTMDRIEQLWTTVNHDPYCWRKLFCDSEWMKGLQAIVTQELSEYREDLHFLMELSSLLEEGVFSNERQIDKVVDTAKMVPFGMRYSLGLTDDAILEALPGKVREAFERLRPALRMWVNSEDFKNLSPLALKANESHQAYEGRLKRQAIYGEALAFYLYEQTKQEELQEAKAGVKLDAEVTKKEDREETEKAGLTERQAENNEPIANLKSVTLYKEDSRRKAILPHNTSFSLSKAEKKIAGFSIMGAMCVIGVPLLVMVAPMLWPALVVLGLGALFAIGMWKNITVDLKNERRQNAKNCNRESRKAAMNVENTLLLAPSLAHSDEKKQDYVGHCDVASEEPVINSKQAQAKTLIDETNRYSSNIYSFHLGGLIREKRKDGEQQDDYAPNHVANPSEKNERYNITQPPVKVNSCLGGGLWLAEDSKRREKMAANDGLGMNNPVSASESEISRSRCSSDSNDSDSGYRSFPEIEDTSDDEESTDYTQRSKSALER